MNGVEDPHEWLTQRAAAQVLDADLGIHPETARRLLVAGLLGRGRATSLATFYRRDTVDEFVSAQRARSPLPVPDRTLVVVRVGNSRVRLGATQQHQLDRLADGWRMSSQWRTLCQLTRFDLRPAGTWFDAWRGRLLRTRAGGAALRVWLQGQPAPWERDLMPGLPGLRSTRLRSKRHH